MLAKRIDIKPENDNFGSLGRYIADASHEGEKLLVAWHAGCLSEQYQAALVEIEATQGMNTRCKGGKTYHLMVSFRPEDEPQLTPEMFRDIEKSFANALGFQDHQRLCGVHKNTNNMHMHVAYNMIHPERFTKAEPFRDFFKLSEACRAMEQKYGLEIDKGIGLEDPSLQINQRAASMEAHSGQQSFQSYVLEHKERIMEGLASAMCWQDAHTALAHYGMVIKPHANGLAVVNLFGKEAMKASAIDRSLSKKSLSDRFGEYVTPPASLSTLVTHHYKRKPLQSKSPKREKLYREYKDLIDRRREQIDAVTKRNKDRIQEIREVYTKERKNLAMQVHSRTMKARLLRILKVQEQQAIEEVRSDGHATIKNIREATPFHNWNGFLKWQASQGNKTALDVLRSRQQTIDPPLTEGNSEITDAYYETKRQVRRQGLEEQKKILTATPQWKNRNRLMAIQQMRQLAAMEDLRHGARIGEQAILFSGVQHTIDNNGIVIFKLAAGGTIRDAGTRLYFSNDTQHVKPH